MTKEVSFEIKVTVDQKKLNHIAVETNKELDKIKLLKGKEQIEKLEILKARVKNQLQDIIRLEPE